MKHFLEIRPAVRHLLAFAVAATLLLPLPSLAASVALATEPLTTTTASNVKPNLMFILDDSGSMGWDYLPDWANDNHPSNGTNYATTPQLFRNSGFNGVAYNPAITYTPPVLYNADGTLDTTTYPDITSPWTAVNDDAYGVQSTNTTNLTLTTASISVSRVRNSRRTSVDNITVNGLEILSASTNSQSRNNDLADAITSRINACTAGTTGNCGIAGYSAVASGSDVTITAPASLGAITYLPALTITGNGTVTATSFFSSASFYVFVPGEYCSTERLTTCVAATAPSTSYPFAAPLRWCNSSGLTDCQAINNSTYKYPRYPGQGSAGSNLLTQIVSTDNSYPYPGTLSKHANRADCAGTTCTYDEEMQNFANWWTYYHTRMQSMKTAVSRAFNSIDSRFRVGFSTINDKGAVDGSEFLSNDTFELAHKSDWFTMLFAQAASSSTPLRGAISKAGRYYGNTISGQVDPIQYSCQQNFTILSSDGYWNTYNESPRFRSNCGAGTNSTTGYGAYKLDNLTCVGDQDNANTRPMYDAAGASSTLADVAKYYYDTDLRTSTLSNCTGGSSPDGILDVCSNNVFTSSTDTNSQQHMTTFTMGLGADGTLIYSSDYTGIKKDVPSASPPVTYAAPATGFDFYQLLNGYGSPTVNWPDPISNSRGERIDDLWHAAVNGRGEYFSASNPDQIVTGFNKTLSSITAKLGSAAAAATSTLNPVSGNNFVYLASYTTVSWTGNLEARTINTGTAVVSETPSWCAENTLQATCQAPSTVVADTSGSSTIYNCVAPNATALTCTSPGVFDSVGLTCATQIDNGCTGTLPPRVAGISSDTRTIYTAPVSGLTALASQNLVPFDSAYAAANPAPFSAANVASLTQWASISTAHTGAKLINYLRGQSANEIRNANAAADQLYRVRNTVMGDTLESQPAFISNPVFNYTYPGYSEYKLAKVGRKGTVFVGSNDGMLHAFVAADDPPSTPVSPEFGGRERWAYVPSMVVGNMWKLADTGYATKHTNYINGSPIISDVCVANCSVVATADWRTILVAGLNGGGRGYFALDITVPETPVLLWEFASDGIATVQDADLGYSYGRPSIARKDDGTWVVIVTSGYNNNTVTGSTGKGYLYVLNAANGAIISKISTGVGSTTTPSGLAQLAVWNEASGGNQAGYAYATDLRGNIWRFDINSGVLTTGTDEIGKGIVLQFATLYSDAAGTLPQPITTPPVLGLVDGHRVIYVGTGKYLEAGDLTNTQKHSLYAIKDVGVTATRLNNPRAYTTTPKMVEQTITVVAGSNVRTGSQNAVDLSADLGWFVDFPDSESGSERVNIAPKLVLGTLLIPTIVPATTVCSPGGYGWFNYFDYANGFAVDGGISNTNVSIKSDSPYVGFNIIYIDGKARLLGVTSNGDISEVGSESNRVQFGGGGSQPTFEGHRAIWHELMPESK